MAMMTDDTQTLLVSQLSQLFDLYSDLLSSLPPESLSFSLPGLPSNKLGEQLWCVAGARESYWTAILEDRDFQWCCTLPFGDATEKGLLSSYLLEQSATIMSGLKEKSQLGPNQFALLLKLFGHECQHQGQLIRYLYGNKLPIPPSWKVVWALD